MDSLQLASTTSIVESTTFKPESTTLILDSSIQIPNQIIISSTKKPNDVKSLLGFATVLLIICSNRPEYLQRSLSYVVKYHPGDSIPIVISQDGNNEKVINYWLTRLDKKIIIKRRK